MKHHWLRVMGGGAGSGLDPDAQAYITAVETADGQALESGVKTAINDFVVGCKADGIWSAIKSSYIFGAARTLVGALVPLAGPSPSSYTVVPENYFRKHGIRNAGTVTTGFSGSNFQQDSLHAAVYIPSTPAPANTFTPYYRLSSGGSDVGNVGLISIFNGTLFHSASNASPGSMGNTQDPSTLLGLAGVARNSSTSYTLYRSGAINPLTRNSAAPRADEMLLAASNGSRSFISCGDYLDLALLDARVSTLMADIAAAIP